MAEFGGGVRESWWALWAWVGFSEVKSAGTKARQLRPKKGESSYLCSVICSMGMPLRVVCRIPGLFLPVA
jgi:hypothetical protein